MTKVLMCTVKVEWIYYRCHCAHPREVFGSLIRIVGLIRRVWRLIITQNTRRFFFTTTSSTLLGVVTSIWKWRYFSSWLNRVCSFNRIWNWLILMFLLCTTFARTHNLPRFLSLLLCFFWVSKNDAWKNHQLDSLQFHGEEETVWQLQQVVAVVRLTSSLRI